MNFIESLFTAWLVITGGSGADTAWSITLAGPEEPGQTLVVTGTIYKSDGKTPFPGVRLYLYHTDARGYYNSGNQGTREPRIRGWLTTDEKGRYQFRTIRPGSYPGSRNPAHIHAKAYSPGGKEEWIDEFLFDDDPFVPEKERAKENGPGDFSHIMKATPGKGGSLHCVRNIILKD
jgi:protocatechuate 3,4-dioxygenase beta subunit